MSQHEEDEKTGLDVDVSVDDAINEALKAVERRESKGASRAGDEKIAALEAKAAELEAAVQTKTEEAAQFKDKYLRSVADLENFRKRALREKDEARTYGAENLLRDLLVVIDNMERAMEAAGEIDQIKQGVKMTHDQFKQILRQHGVEVVEAHGAPFDPAHHEAVAHVETADHLPGTIMQEHRRGYKFRERLLRPSMVSVAKALPQAPEGNS